MATRCRASCRMKPMSKAAAPVCHALPKGGAASSATGPPVRLPCGARRPPRSAVLLGCPGTRLPPRSSSCISRQPPATAAPIPSSQQPRAFPSPCSSARLASHRDRPPLWRETPARQTLVGNAIHAQAMLIRLFSVRFSANGPRNLRTVPGLQAAL